MKSYATLFMQGMVILLPFLVLWFPTYPASQFMVLGLLAVSSLVLGKVLWGAKMVKISQQDVLLLCLGLALLASVLINSRADVTEPITVFKAILYAQLYVLARNVHVSNALSIALIVSATSQALMGAGQLAGLLPSPNYLFPLTGTFRNPAPFGLLMSLGLVSTLGRLLVRRNWALIACGLLILGMLIASGSRAAWLASAIACGYLLWRQPNVQKVVGNRRMVPVVSGILLVLIAGLYLIRMDSANGRVFIWRVSAGMAAEKSLLGHGAGSFPEKYPFYQARYFGENPDSPFAKVADNVRSPFNEYVSLLTQTGIIGLALFLAAVFVATRYAGKNDEGKTILLVLLIFGVFSYPFALTYFVVIFVLAMGALSRGGRAVRLPGYVVALSIGSILVATGMYSYALRGKLPITYINDRAYLDTRAKQLCTEQQYDSAAILFARVPTIELCTDLARGYATSGRYGKAIPFAEQARDMAPDRALPYYLLFRIYELREMHDSAAYYARQVVNGNFKIENTTTLKAKREAQAFLNDCFNLPK